MVWANFFQVFGAVICVASVAYCYTVIETVPLGFINIAALSIYSLGATLEVQPWKVRTWHCVALYWNLAIFSSDY